MLEGTDGSGKTTQTNLLMQKLQKQGRAVKQISFPQYGKPSATMVEAYLRGEFGSADEVGPYKASVLYAVDRFAASNDIQSWLDDGAIVIANRYVASNMGHQGGKIKNAQEREKYFDWNYNLEYTVFNIPKPDINIILHVPTNIAKELVDKREAAGTHDRTGERDIHHEDLQHLRDAEQAYLDIAQRYDEFTLISCAPNGSLRSIEDIHDEIWNKINQALV